jgi:hypothetical protein
VNPFKRMRSRWKKPSATAEHFAEVMERGGLPAQRPGLTVGPAKTRWLCPATDLDLQMSATD